MAYRGNNNFKTQLDGIQRAKRAHMCTACRYSQPKTFKTCPGCGESGHRVYFPSKAEMQRAATLLLLRDSGKVSELKFHPRYNLVVKGRKVGVYIADATYRNHNQELVVEDTKPEKYMTDTARLKISLFEAIYGVTINIPQQPKKEGPLL